jgi:hypothetical protein
MKTVSFYIHLLMVIIALLGPFLIDWYIIVPIYILVCIQFLIFGRCLFNDTHGLRDDSLTFYSEILFRLNIPHNPTKLKVFVRYYLYPILALITLLLQLGIGIQPCLTINVF